MIYFKPVGGEEREAFGVCPEHDGRPAIAVCPRCGRYMCALCVSRGAEVSGQLLCRGCVVGLASRRSLRRDVPWENRRGASYLTAFFATWRTVIFAPRAFFGGLSPGGTLVKPLVFAVICSAIGFVGVLLWLVVTAFSYVGPSSAALVAAMTLAAAPVANVSAFLVTVAFLHVLARGLGGGGDIRATIRATAYCQAAAVAEVIPPIGTIVAFVLRLSLYGWGVSAVHGFSLKKAIAFYVIILVTAAGFVYFGVQLLTPFLPAVV